MSQFTVQVKDGGLIDSTTEKSIIQAAIYVGNFLDRYIIWKGILDIEIQIKPASALTFSLVQMKDKKWHQTQKLMKIF